MNAASRVVRIGNAQAFWGDRSDAAAELLSQEPELDFLVLDYLAEVSMSILAVQRERHPDAGYARDVVDVVRSIAAYRAAGGRCRLITNAGGLDPLACAHTCRQVLADAGCGNLRLAVVSGDDVLAAVQQSSAGGPSPEAAVFAHAETGEPLAAVRDRLVTASAYLGAEPITRALDQGADLVITGRVADPSLVVGACRHHFGWAEEETDRIAGATVAGHLIECGTQVTGGNATDWLTVPDRERIGFPVVEVADDGSCTVCLPRHAGGVVNEWTVKEQLLYEIGDPGRYLSPDATVSFLTLRVEDLGGNRVRVSGAVGGPAPATLKVSATYRDGYRAAGTLTIRGDRCVAKALHSGQLVLERVRRAGHEIRDSVVECLGSGVAVRQGDVRMIMPAEGVLPVSETVLRVAIESESQAAVRHFSREVMPLITAGPPGTTGYAEGRPRVHPVFRYWPCLIPATEVIPEVTVLPPLSAEPDVPPAEAPAWPPSHAAATPDPLWPSTVTDMLHALESDTSVPTAGVARRRLRDLAIARSGDKGSQANIGVIARCADDLDVLLSQLTEDRVLAFFRSAGAESVTRYVLPNLHAVNFVVRGILRRSLQIDAQGKTLGQQLLEFPIDDSSSAAAAPRD